MNSDILYLWDVCSPIVVGKQNQKIVIIILVTTTMLTWPVILPTLQLPQHPRSRIMVRLYSYPWMWRIWNKYSVQYNTNNNGYFVIQMMMTVMTTTRPSYQIPICTTAVLQYSYIFIQHRCGSSSSVSFMEYLLYLYRKTFYFLLVPRDNWSDDEMRTDETNGWCMTRSEQR